MATKLGNLPTMKIDADELARFAREAEARMRESESGGERETFRPLSPPSEDDLDVDIDVAEGDPSDTSAPPPPEDVSGEIPAGALDELASVPFLVASREDLAWFELDELASIVLGMVDGEASVEAIQTSLALPPDKALAVLRDLRRQGVIEFL
jgi:hypothetical protein